MTLANLPVLTPTRSRTSRSWLDTAWRVVLVGFAGLLIAVGFVGSLLPGHLGVPVLVVGLIILLRTSMTARRHFIGLQRRHPKVVFPIRRLLRRQPEVLPVMWQQVLRMERLVLPRQWRTAKGLRRRYFTRRP